jgi:single-stranded DNA-binding protein
VSLHVLAAGSLIAAPQQRTGASGKPFMTGTLRVPTEGEEGAVLVSLIVFDADAQAALGRLRKGDAASITGRAKLSKWQGKDGERTGLSVVAERVMSAYEARKQRAGAGSG